MNNYIKPGKTMSFTATANVESGELIRINQIVGVSLNKLLIGEVGELQLCGVVELDKSDEAELLQGNVCEYNETLKIVTGGGADFVCGKIYETALEGTLKVKIILPYGPG